MLFSREEPPKLDLVECQDCRALLYRERAFKVEVTSYGIVQEGQMLQPCGPLGWPLQALQQMQYMPHTQTSLYCGRCKPAYEFATHDWNNPKDSRPESHYYISRPAGRTEVDKDGKPIE